MTGLTAADRGLTGLTDADRLLISHARYMAGLQDCAPAVLQRWLTELAALAERLDDRIAYLAREVGESRLPPPPRLTDPQRAAYQSLARRIEGMQLRLERALGEPVPYVLTPAAVTLLDADAEAAASLPRP